MATATIASPKSKTVIPGLSQSDIALIHVSYPELLRWVVKEASRPARTWRDDTSLTKELANALVDEAEDVGFDTTGVTLLGFEVLLERYVAAKACGERLAGVDRT